MLISAVRDRHQILPPMVDYYLHHSILKLRETEGLRNIRSLDRADSRISHDPQSQVYIPSLYDRWPWRQARTLRASADNDQQ